MSDLISRDDAIRELSGACSTWEDDAKVQEIVMAIPSAEGGDAEMNEVKSPYMKPSPNGADLISRADAIDAVRKELVCDGRHETHDKTCRFIADVLLSALPSADAVSREEHIKELNDLAVAWKAKFAKAEKITDEIYDETMAKVAKECEECKERLRNIRPSAEAVQGWIPCSERVPRENEYVDNVCKYYLIQDEYGDMHVAHLSGRGWETIEFIKALGCDVIAWMPLPTPYKGGDSE